MESAKHRDAKGALIRILLDDGYLYASDEVAHDTIATALGNRDYILDVLACKDDEWFDFEVDGKKGHSTKTDLWKMRNRDQALKEKGIKTIRIKTQDLVGRKRQPLDIILAEIAYQKLS